MPEIEKADTLAIIPLRAGSKGLVGKNLRLLNGKPLYRHSVDQALRTVGQCVITTDIPEILECDLPVNCEAVKRPQVLAQDDTPMTPVLTHLLEWLKSQERLPRRAVLMQATSPLRRDEDVTNALELYETGKFELVMSVVAADSGILKYGFAGENGTFTPVSNPQFCFSNRQSLPQIVRPNGAVYVFSPEFFLKNGGFETDSIGSIEMPEAYSIDIDTNADLKAAEVFLAQTSFRKAG